MSKVNARKNSGRPRVDSEELRARALRPQIEAIDEWADAHEVTRAEAIRRLIELGLKAVPEPTSIDGLIDHYKRIGRPDLAEALEQVTPDIEPQA